MVASSRRVGNLNLHCFLPISRKNLDDGKGMSGRGCLTNVQIDTFQSFYGKVLQANNRKRLEMARATRAILKHYCNTNEKPQYEDCLTMPNSWCSFQKGKALHQNTYKPAKNAILVSIQKVIRPLLEKLSNSAFLSDCSNALTSNANESYHHVLLDLVPKEQYTSSEVIELAVQLGVCLYISDFYWVYSGMLARCKLPYMISSLVSFRCIDIRCIANTDYRG